MQYTIFIEITKLITFTDAVKNDQQADQYLIEMLADLFLYPVYFNVAEVPTGCADDACIS
jgi:hypothetical protein